MKVLRISRGGLELAHAHIHRPLATIGRSPSCDVVLRAPGVEPIHFLMEWLGAGTFDPRKGQWSIFDISRSSDDSGEGILVSAEPVEFQGFQFAWVEDQLEDTPDIGGGIGEELTGKIELAKLAEKASAGAAPLNNDLLEIVQIRSDSGAIEEVVHARPPARARGSVAYLPEIPELKVIWRPGQEESLVRIILEEMPGAKVHRRGVLLTANEPLELGPTELFQVDWKGRQVFFRLVPAAKLPEVPRVWIQDKLLLNLSLLGLLFGALVLSGTYWWARLPHEEPPAPPPRVARVQVAPPPAVEKMEGSGAVAKPVQGVKEKSSSAPSVAKAKAPPSPSTRKPKAPVDPRSVGILGMLRKSGAAAQGTTSELQVSTDTAPETASGAEGKLVLKRPPPKVAVTDEDAGTARGKDDSRLISASASGKGLSPGGGKALGGLGTGTQLSQAGGMGNAGDPTGMVAGFGQGDGSGIEVSGGLDRETIRRIILAHRGEVRACYEKALLANPKISGRVVFTWMISPQGPVSTSRIVRTDTASQALDTCVLEVLRGIHFPAAKNGRPTTVIYPFVFQSRS